MCNESSFKICFLFHESCLQLKGQNSLHRAIASSLMSVRVLPLCRGVSLGSVPEAAMGIRAAHRLLERGMRQDGSLCCQWREGVIVPLLCYPCQWCVYGPTYLMQGGGMSLKGYGCKVGSLSCPL